MRIMLGNKIKELRKRDKRTQDDMLYKSVFEDGNYGWFNRDICILYLNAARICNRNKDYNHAIDFFEKAYDYGRFFMKNVKVPMKRPTSACISDAIELPSRFICINEGTFKEYIGFFSEDVISKLRSNPKFISIF